MKKRLFTVLSLIMISFSNFAQEEIDSTAINIERIEKSLEYQTGSIDLESGNAKLSVPPGFRFLDKKQSNYVLTDLWGNPLDNSILGMLVPDNRGVLDNKSWVYTISFDEMGYVKDEDAEDMDYTELLAEQQKETLEANPEREKSGYPAIQLIGWASQPYYDKDKKILHWAKELKFGTDSLNTLNYNLRVLGRKGIFMLNAIASINELPEVKQSIDKVITSVEFKEGHRYSDYLPDTDNVAAWTIGGLVAGKILAKVGFLALLLKFWKLIALGVAGAGSMVWKFFKRKKEEPNSSVEEPTLKS